MATFVLVHGAWHGGWCFQPLVRELEARGHRAVAPDLPCDDPDAGLAEYAAAVEEADDAIAVGHSLGGLTIPLLPARALVWLCGFVPRPGVAMVDDAAEALVPGFPGGVERDELGRSRWVDLDTAVARMYGDCPPHLGRWAAEQLRPQARAPQVEPWPLDAIPGVERVSILCRGDAAVRPDWSRQVARERLGVEALELDGGHSPFLSRPAELAELLCSLA